MPPPSPGPTPPPDPDPTPPPEPGPFEAGPILPIGSPKFDIFTCGRFTSGGARIEGSIVMAAEVLATTAWGGTNCRTAAFGRRPLLAAKGDRSPPPPPPAISCGAGLAT